MAKPPKKPAGTPPNPNPDDDEGDEGGDDGERPLTRGEVTRLINSVVSTQLGRRLTPAIEAGLAPVLQRLDALKPGKGDDEGDDVDEGEPGRKPGKADPAVAKLVKQVDNLTKQVKERDDRLASETTARKAALIDNELVRALGEAGVDKLRVRGALSMHRAAAFVDEAGVVKYKVKRDGYDEDIEPSDALKEWAATDEGKSYIAPTGAAGGSGARAPRAAGAQRKGANAAEGKVANQEAAANALPELIDQMIGGGGGSFAI